MMDAVLFHAKDEVALREAERPRPAHGEVVLRVRATGVGQAEMDLLHGRFGASFPVIPGRDFAGEVVEIGAGVSGVAVGDRVVVDPILDCGRCPACRRGRTNLCAHIAVYGASLNGGLAEYCAVRAANVVGIGDLDFSVAALAPAIGGVLNGLSLVGPSRGDTALVFGAGPIGLLSAMIMRTRGVMNIVLADSGCRRLEIAERLGFRAVPCHSETLDTMRRGADLVVEATGEADAYSRIGEQAADGGRILLMGLSPSDDPLPISSFEMVRRQLTVVGSHSLNCNLREALGMLTSLGSVTSRLVNRKMSLPEIVPIFHGGTQACHSGIQVVMP